MKQMKYILALAVMLTMAGCAYAIEVNMIDMPGGTSSEVTGTGASTGYALSFVSLTPTPVGGPQLNQWALIGQDILSVATINGKGSAKSITHVDSLQTKSISGDNFKLEVGGQGRTEATAESTEGAEVASVARVHSRAYADIVGFGPALDKHWFAQDILGNAWISSAIGHEWSPIGLGVPGLPGYQFGLTLGKPEGVFEAASNAAGEATYKAEIDNSQIVATPANWVVLNGQGIYQDYYAQIEGDVKAPATTTLEASVANNHAEVKGMVPSIVGAQLFDWQRFLPGVLKQQQLYVDLPEFYAIPTQEVLFSQGQDCLDDLPLIAAITAGSAAGDHGPDLAAAGVANLILVAAENDGLPAPASTTAAGTVAGSALATAREIVPTGEEFKVRAYKDDQMAADVRVLNALDAASAIAVLATGGIASDTPLGVSSGAIADTFAGVRRVNPGDAADGSDRTWAVSFIPHANWETWAVELDGGMLDDQATVSGSLIQDSDNGMGSGAFLQYKKNGPAWANTLIAQGASADILPVKVTFQMVGADVMGPKAHSLGSSAFDGSGTSLNAENLYAQAYDDELISPYDPLEISQTIDNVDAFMWTDGTNDLQYNGLTFTATLPTFDPAGVGQWTGMINAYLPSPAQRETIVGMLSTQP